MNLQEEYGGRVLTTDEYAIACTKRDKLRRELENLNFDTGDDYILFKWGSLKGWELNSDKGKKLSDEYLEIGRSMSAMSQKDTDRQKEIILEMIDECHGSLQNDWDGDMYTKQQAKDYINGYDSAKSTT